MGTIKTTNIQSISGSGTVTLGTSGETFTVPSGVTVNMSSATQTGVGGNNTPSFMAFLSSDQTLSDNTWTKIQYNVENVDSAGAFDSSTNYRFTPQTSGYYFVSCNGTCGNTSDNSIDSFKLKLYKNGSEITSTQSRRDWDVTGINFNDSLHTSVIVQMNGSSDYIEAYMLVNVTGGTPRVESQKNSMQIFKMT